MREPGNQSPLDDQRVRVLLRELRRAMMILSEAIKAALDMPAK